MSVMWRERDFYERLFLFDEDSTEHNSFYEAVHSEGFHLSPLEERMLHIVCQNKGRRIDEQTEIVGTIGIA